MCANPLPKPRIVVVPSTAMRSRRLMVCPSSRATSVGTVHPRSARFDPLRQDLALALVERLVHRTQRADHGLVQAIERAAAACERLAEQALVEVVGAHGL